MSEEESSDLSSGLFTASISYTYVNTWIAMLYSLYYILSHNNLVQKYVGIGNKLLYIF
jgi:hypothetical protein